MEERTRDKGKGRKMQKMEDKTRDKVKGRKRDIYILWVRAVARCAECYIWTALLGTALHVAYEIVWYIALYIHRLRNIMVISEQNTDVMNVHCINVKCTVYNVQYFCRLQYNQPLCRCYDLPADHFMRCRRRQPKNEQESLNCKTCIMDRLLAT